MGMRITIQNKGAESAPIIIDVPNKSKEAFGVSDAFSGITVKTKNDLFSKDAFRKAIENAKEWADDKGYTMASLDDVKKNKQTLFTSIFRRPGKVKATDAFNKAITNMALTTVNGATISVMEADYSIANMLVDTLLVPGLGSLWSMVRKLSGNGLILTFIWFKNSNGKVFSRGLVKAKWLKHDAQNVL